MTPAERRSSPMVRSPAVRDPRPVVWALSITRLSVLLRDVAPEFDQRARIEILPLGFEAAVDHVRRHLNDCDVLVSAGSNGAYLKNRIGKPVVLIKPDGFALMQALTRARTLSQRIGLITHQTYLPVFSEFQRSFGLGIEQRSFATQEDARHCVAELKGRGIEVIVGTGMVADLAERSGLQGVLLYSADSVRAAFEDALDLARAIDAATGLTAPGLRRNTPTHKYALDHLLGESPAMVVTRSRLALYAATDATVLIEGDTGTGKELAAQALHAASARSRQPFVAVNCGAIVESLLESELFGHEEGAFTGARRGGRAGLVESANGGTLFLDEIGEMPLPLQTRLLRVLEEQEVVRVGSSRPTPVNLRVVAATHCRLDDLVAAGRFRSDLYYRLNVLRLRMPRLAERPGDIPALAAAFLQRAAPHRCLDLSADARALLCGYTWPGNVRELRNIIERVAALCASADRGLLQIDASLLQRYAPELAGDGDDTSTTSLPASDAPAPGIHAMPLAVRRPQRAELLDLIARCGGREKACTRLSVSRTTLWRWLREDGSSTTDHPRRS